MCVTSNFFQSSNKSDYMQNLCFILTKMNIFFKTFFYEREIPPIFARCMNLEQCYQLMDIYPPYKIDNVPYIKCFLEGGHIKNLSCCLDAKGEFILDDFPYKFHKKSLKWLLKNEIFFNNYIPPMTQYLFKNYTIDNEILFMFMDSPKLMENIGYEVFVQIKLNGMMTGNWKIYDDFRYEIYKRWNEWESPYDIIEDFRDTKRYGDSAKIRNGARICIKKLKHEIEEIKAELDNYMCYDLTDEVNSFLMQ